MDFDSFSHGQIKSKIWLCEQIEPLIKPNSKVLILGGWVNVLGFMLMTRQENKYSLIQSVDSNPTTIETANKITDRWVIDGRVKNKVADANTVPSNEFDIIINCSPEHMDSIKWFSNINPNTLVCIQSSNVTSPEKPWFITNANPTLDSFLSKFPLSRIHFYGTLPITYDNWGYDRYMLIGYK